MDSKFSIYPIITSISLLIIWELTVRIFDISPIIFPGPVSIVNVIITRFYYLALNSIYTLYESVMGFIIGFLFAFLMATGFQFSKVFKKSFLPFAVATRAIPTIAIAPIIVLWFGTGYSSKIVLSAFISFFPILINYMKGLNQVENDVIDYLKSISASEWQIYFKTRLPNSAPYLFAGLKVASSFAIIGAIIAEFIGSSKGIGYIIKSSTYYSDTDLTFAGIIIASLIGLAFYWVIEKIERRLIYWDTNSIVI